ncbi:MAG: DUF3618 domain-containing protein [Actinomycetota bacterium]|nr:MAG: DUF3618 domain-containing protein [Actinomycetota bacterium]
MAKESSPPAGRGIAEIEAEIADARASLAGNLAALRQQAAPKAVAQRQYAKARGFFVDEYGGVRPERIAGIVVALAAVIVVRRLIRSRRG